MIRTFQVQFHQPSLTPISETNPVPIKLIDPAFCPQSGTKSLAARVKFRSMNAETENNEVSIPIAAERLGLDSFSVYMLIQSDLVHPQRERLGELTIPQAEMGRLLKIFTSSTANKEVRQLC